ncbi:hypothetical protein BDF21DRAFT_432103 [Thamnidium elegans]|nr:hypothetical protein BDF21DRAFT_432103 [Thamnidium elegans]
MSLTYFINTWTNGCSMSFCPFIKTPVSHILGYFILFNKYICLYILFVTAFSLFYFSVYKSFKANTNHNK